MSNNGIASDQVLTSMQMPPKSFLQHPCEAPMGDQAIAAVSQNDKVTVRHVKGEAYNFIDKAA
jgi:hypothetical protein